jgi:hypothetical protein
MISKIFENLKHIVTQISRKLKLFPQVKKEGRPLAIREEDALTFSLYKQRSTRVTKKSIYDDFDLKKVCSYKTFVVSINRMVLSALCILFHIMRMNKRNSHIIKFTDATDIPVCLTKNGKRHRTMGALSAWGHSGKGFYYGLKLTMTRDDDGRLLNLSFDRSNKNDRDIFRKINKNINGVIIADAGYVSKELEKDMNTNERWCLIKPLKKMKKLSETWQLELYNKRFKIEFDFRSLKMFHGLVTSLPRSIDGYIGNYIFSLLSFILA